MNCIVYYISLSIVFLIQQVVFNCNIGGVDHMKAIRTEGGLFKFTSNKSAVN